MSKLIKTMDGNEAAAYISYAFTEVATIYPITPSSPMAELVDTWAVNGKKNLFGQQVRLIEMQSEAGVAGAMHGVLESGALATSYTSSQGLLLMVPTMYRIAGQLHPGVLHVASRAVGTHAFSIFGEHSDVMACRQTGFAMLCTASVQEIMDLAGVAHLAAIKSRVPFLHFFDGFRTSHEVQKVEVMDYEDLNQLLDYDALDAFRKRSLNPERPVQRSTVQNPDVYFQARESGNIFYDKLPDIVEEYMGEINKITNRDYHLFNYYGAEDATEVIVAMGSVSGVIEEVVDHLNAQGRKVGYLQVHLFRPFSIRHFMERLPKTVEKVAALDRTKEAGSVGEPLYLDVCSALQETDCQAKVIAGRYGLATKDVTAGQILAVYDNLKEEAPNNHFTVGIVDDVTFHSLPVNDDINTMSPEIVSCKFWGLGSDGTVGANKNSIKIIGDHTNMYVQAYFEYDTKKSGGVTRSHLRFGNCPIKGSYLVKQADFAACHNQSYMDKYDIVQEIRPNGLFLLNCTWKEEELEKNLSAEVKKYIAENKIRFYIIDAMKIGKEIGLGNRINAILQSAFFKLTNIIPYDQAVEYMKAAIEKTYREKGEKVIQMNWDAVDQGKDALVQVKVPDSWLHAADTIEESDVVLPEYVEKFMKPVNALKGDSLLVSVFSGREDGTVPLGTSKYEKRGMAPAVPKWDAGKCIQCNMCSLVCPHGAIRPFLLTEEETEQAPGSYVTVKAKGKNAENYQYRVQISPLDCLGCGSCVNVCLAKEKALTMETLDSQRNENSNWHFSVGLSVKENPMDKMSVKGSQFETPLLEFSGACAGCGETPYAKILTQLFGDRMYLANASGCTQAWGAASPNVPYTKNKDGHGPAFSNSLFENNAEFSLGMCLAVKQQRERLAGVIDKLQEKTNSAELKAAIEKWKQHYDDGEHSRIYSNTLLDALKYAEQELECKEFVKEIRNNQEHLVKKSLWMYGGDGWAYDIGYGGLDHVLSTGEDVNILVVDTEVYSNTGGQASKATQIGAVAQFAASGKRSRKKDLGKMAMVYENVYVASVAMGANPAQLVKVLKEAENYRGPSLIIAYAPCISHGIVKGMGNSMQEAKLAVESGYWFLYHYNPEYRKENKNPFVLDSKKPEGVLNDFLMGEVRFAALFRTFPEDAQYLMGQACNLAAEKYKEYRRMEEE